MLIKPFSSRSRQGGGSITEMIVTLGVMVIVGAAFSAFLYSSSQTLMSMYTYAGIDSANQNAINLMTREIRLARRVISINSGNLTIENTNGVAVTYAYSGSQRTLVRNAGTSSSTLLRDCDAVSFTLCKGEQPVAFEDFVLATNPAEAKVIDFTWSCSRRINSGAKASDSLASAKIVMRNQGK